MRCALSPEQRDYAAALRDLLAAADVPSVARAWGDGDVAPGRALWSKLAAMGALGVLAPEAAGGLDASAVELVVVLTEIGRAAAPGPFVETLALPALLPSGSQLLADAVGGDAVVTLAAPPHVPFACDGAVADVVLLVDGDRLLRAADRQPRESVDRTRRLAAVTPGDDLGAVDARRAFEVAALGTAAQILGAGQAALARAVEYAKQRTQFGRPIGSQQAVKHQLADAHVGLELAQPLVWAAALSLDTDAPTLARDVSAAKVACTDAAYRASRVALQVHGAIGYTAEYDLSLWLVKIRALVSAWGTQARHRARVLASLRGEA
ncbi:MAG: acyl-CoA dehydrogenase family protein [Jatrophihabitans sp.]|uniref:acyl-CoA dehydrogenase family protein n=1 Tax=Jatrophihabitans sp. TaxID=1932789 RepID=UPI003F7EF374